MIESIKKNMVVRCILKNENTMIVLVLIALCFVTTFVNPNFASQQNITNMLRKLSQISFISLGMTFVIIGGGIDLSVGSVVGLGGIVAGTLMRLNFPTPVAVAAAILVGASLGLFNGFFVTRIKIPAFIVTLGTLYIARGLVNVISQGKPIFPLKEGFNMVFGQAVLFGIPISVYIMTIFIFIMYIILNYTVFGRSLMASGGNEKTSITAGINVANIRLLSYVILGSLAAFTGLLIASRMRSSHPSSGSGWELTAIAASVIGGTSVNGGIGSVFGTIIGAAIMTVLEISMVMMKVSVYYQNIIVGLIIIGAVVLDQYKRKKFN